MATRKKFNVGSEDRLGLGTKQGPHRAAPKPTRLASATPQYHNARHGHKPSAQDPMKVIMRGIRRPLSNSRATKKALMSESVVTDMMTEETFVTEQEVDRILAESRKLKN